MAHRLDPIAPEPKASLSKKEEEARRLYWAGYRIAEIGRMLDVVQSTVYNWKRIHQWDQVSTVRRVETALDARLVLLINKETKAPGDLNEILELTRALEIATRARRNERRGEDEDFDKLPTLPGIPGLPPRKHKHGRRKKNDIPQESIEKLRKRFEDELFGYQRVWLEQQQAGRRIRNILKSRQIGATWYFAREALINAAETGDNQIFLSASKAQAHVFKQYILQFVGEVCDINLSGDPIILGNGATLYFLGTNARTAQGYHGHTYTDEYFWIPRFKTFSAVTSGMAMHKRWRKTYMSTPSAISHEAYPFWAGKMPGRGRPPAGSKKGEIDISHKALAAGRLCDDRQWRQIVTIEDAVAAGCDLFDLEELRQEYSAAEYANLLMCEFIDDTESIWPLSVLQKCQVDSWVQWSDFKPLSARPMGVKPVWIGYDPSRTRDGAAVIVVAPPAVAGGKFRVVAKHEWYGMPFPEQARRIKEICESYRVEYMELDTTGPGGLGTYDLVQEFYPAAVRSMYSPQVKAAMIARAQNIIANGRLEYDAGWNDLTQALMSIRMTMTAQGGQITYTSGRSEEVGHADLAWALLHALGRADITAGGGAGKQSVLELC